MFGILGPESLVFFCFIQIALVEEMSKLAAFHLGELVRREESIVDSPVATMFYAGISSFGFAFMENIDYIFQYGGSVIIIRSITSTMIHFLCGLILGYWVAASRMPSVLENRSLFEIILQTRPVLKKFIYYAIGITCAITLHGMYDYSCSNASSDPLMSYMIIFGGIISAYLAARRLVEKERK
jgi:RsiW-degrading membrane proteinase PrsW (M82 family)